MTRTLTLKLRLLCSVLLVAGSLFSQEKNVSFLFAGDVMQHDGQINAAYNQTTKTYCYDDGFKFVKPILQQYDIRIANLEATHAGKPYKGYPQFSAPDELSESLVNTGFNVILTANNHSCDGGEHGVKRTLDVLDELGVKHTGTFRSSEERDSTYPLMVRKNNMNVAILNYTYGTNGLKVDPPLIVNYIDSNIIKADVERARELNADYIVCTMHWGSEYEHLPNGYQQKYEEICYRYGVDMVIGGHPHVLQPVKRTAIDGKEKLTAWSLGNFVSNQRARYKNGGMMLTAAIGEENGEFTLRDAGYYLFYVHTRKEGEITPYYLLPDFNYSDYRPDFLRSDDLARMKTFFSDSRELFAEHNSNGITEYRVNNNAAITGKYELMLTNYYSVALHEVKSELFDHPVFGPALHKTVSSDGKEYILYEQNKSEAELQGCMNFLSDCGFEGKIEPVLVKPGVVVKLSE